MLIKYLYCVLLLMESEFGCSLAERKEIMYSGAAVTDCSPITNYQFLQTMKKNLTGNGCRNLTSLPAEVLNCTNGLTLVNCDIEVDYYSLAGVEKLVIVNSNVILNGRNCTELCDRDDSLNSSLQVLEVYSSSLNYMGNIELPALRNLTVYNSKMSVNLFDLSWTMHSRHLKNISVIDTVGMVVVKNDTKPVLKPKEQSCVGKYIDFQRPESLKTVSFRGTEFHCSYISTAKTQWFLTLAKGGFIDEPEKTCTGSFFPTEVTLKIAEVSEAFNNMTKECPDECCCWYSQMNSHGGKFSYTVSMNCSNQNLTEIPGTGIANLVAELDISHNEIRSLSRIKHSFHNLLDLDADFNNLESIASLEGSTFAKTFRKMSLRSNMIPIDDDLKKFVRKRLSGNKFGSRIRLGNNSKEVCRCDMATTIKPWLWNNLQTISDYDSVYCLNNTSNGTKRVPLFLLYKESACNEEKSNFWLIVIIVELVMMSLILLKFSYDFWAYKKCSQLPWVALKLF